MEYRLKLSWPINFLTKIVFHKPDGPLIRLVDECTNLIESIFWNEIFIYTGVTFYTFFSPPLKKKKKKKKKKENGKILTVFWSSYHATTLNKGKEINNNLPGIIEKKNDHHHYQQQQKKKKQFRNRKQFTETGKDYN